MNKKAMTVQTIFYILMTLMMIWLIVFGIGKLFTVKDELSEQERRELKQEFIQGLEYCSDPLNRGSKKIISFSHGKFNTVCLLAENTDFSSNEEINQELNLIREGGDNVVFIDSSFKYAEQGLEIDTIEIVDSFEVTYSTPNTKCFYDTKKGSSDVVVELAC